ncbi:hypothetical protein ITP53_04545 [Nonomuraea sp. K274]|uniref:DUF7134 domain-containing protein n=1 Tax=Nonomuraea cypriaca TaxID=1187855 RepID=A0A931EX09_9ACTN|nr:hypothetical protein [Nonomuraea cypriaca]MBF8185017.1 hypothetical protein [Nonomuraea cypriaca]
MIRRILASGERHPRAVDAGLAVLVAVAGGFVEGSAGWGWLWAVCLPLVWRRRAPVPVLYVTVGLGLVAYAAGVQAIHPAAAILVAAYTVARHRPWRRLVPPVTVIEGAFLSGAFLGGLRWDDLVTLTFAMAAAVLLGVTVQTRRAYLAGLRERAERLEHERDQRNPINSRIGGQP